ncbi:M24 family metallopeptidase [Chloroflexota bacterium]
MASTQHVKSLSFGSAGVDWQERINFARMRQERLVKFQNAMKKYGLAAVLLSKPDSIRYTTAVKGPLFVLGLRYTLVFAEHAPIIYELGDTLEQNRVNCPWIKPENWRYSYCWLNGIGGPGAVADETKKFADAIKRDLKDKGLDKEKLGFDVIDEPGRHALSEAGIELVTAMPAMMEARRTKTKDEIDCTRMACTISDIAWSTVCETLKTGIRENELAAEALAALMRAGAEMVITGVTSGPNCYELSHLSNKDRIIELGDLVYMNLCGTSYMGYQVCYYRTFIVGRKPNDKEKDWNKRCYERIYSVIGEIKPGATTADAVNHFLPASTWGYEAEQRLLVAEIGHGIGLSAYEPPVIQRVWSLDHPQPFEKGMIIAVESREGEPFVGGVRLEEMVVVTDTGCEVITRWPCKELIAVNIIT